MMAGYSGKPLSEKLGIKTGFAVTLIGAPSDYLKMLAPLPPDVHFCALEEQPRLVHYFCTERHVLEGDLDMILRRMRPDTALWISWPKKHSGVTTNVTEHAVREIALPTGLVDNKICAVDLIWTAMRFVIRLEHRHE